MFSHTLFSLPFAMIAMFIAANGLPNHSIIIYGIIALVAARTGANAFNRYADRFIDAKNPRTAHRHLPTGKLMGMEVLLVTFISYAIYFYAAYQINMLCFYLAIVPLIFFTLYPYTKRFTSFCHLVLGVSCAFAVIGAWMAVTGELFYLNITSSNEIIFTMNVIPIILFIAVALWNAGFDTIYGSQDISFDRELHLFSIPAKLGLRYGLMIARLFHFLMILLLISLLLFYKELSYIYLIGIFISSILFLFEHKIIKPSNPMIMKIASYKLNQIISITIFVFTTIDIFFI